MDSVDKVRETIARIAGIVLKEEATKQEHRELSLKKAKQILDIKVPCRECVDGKYSESGRGSDGFESCPVCHGTGGRTIEELIEKEETRR